MGSSILYFLLLVLGISLNFGLDICYKQDRFIKILLEKGFEVVLNKKGGTVALNLSFILLLIEVDPILEK